MLGLKFKEAPFTKAVFIEKILPNTEAERLQKAGQIRVGDEVVMVSATFGDEMWSARGVGKYRLEKSIAVRQGMTISFVFENSDDNSKKRKQEMAKQASKEAERMTRLQRQVCRCTRCAPPPLTANTCLAKACPPRVALWHVLMVLMVLMGQLTCCVGFASLPSAADQGGGAGEEEGVEPLRLKPPPYVVMAAARSGLADSCTCQTRRAHMSLVA